MNADYRLLKLVLYELTFRIKTVGSNLSVEIIKYIEIEVCCCCWSFEFSYSLGL